MSDGLAEFVTLLVERLMDRARKAREDAENPRPGIPAEFEQGRHVAYYEVLDIAKSIAVIHDIDIPQIRLLNLEKELLSSEGSKES